MTTMRTTTWRWTTGILVVTAMALLAGCGGDDGDETATTAEATTTTLSDEEFVAAVDQITADLEAAGTDLCAVFEVAVAPAPQDTPSTPAKVEATVGATVAIMRSLAATEPVDPEAAALLTEAADEVESAIAAEDYDVEYFESDEFLQLVAGEDLQTAFGEYQTRASEECAPTPTTTVAGETTTSVAG